MTHQQNEGEGPEEADVADFERRFAEVIERFWRRPRSPASTDRDEAKWIHGAEQPRARPTTETRET